MASESASTSADAWKESTNPLDHCDVVSKKANTTDYLCKWCNRGFSGSKTRCYIHLTGDGKGVARCSITICIDGWSDAQNRPILNVLAVCPKGAMFLGAVDTSGQVKSAEYIAQVLTEYIEAVGADRVVQVRALIVCACCHTDTANYFATCFAMGRQLSSTSRDIAAYTAHQPRGTDGLPEFACTLSVNTTYETLQLTVAVVSLMFASRCALAAHFLQ